MWLSHSSAATTTTCGMLGSALNTLQVLNKSVLSTPLGRKYYY